jgi:CheY-like chemotaxis protein/predicted DNA binding protein
VLLVDDDQDFVTLASTLLETESERLETLTETDPRDALSRRDFNKIDCIISDYRMPDMDGIEFLEAVRSEYPELPFIMFTGKGGEEIAQQAITAGVSDYIVKDGSPEQYAISANRIENLVMQYRTRRRSAHKQLLDTLTQAVFRTVLNEPTRQAIEQGVCDQLVTFDLYSFAWIGARDSQTGRIQPRAQAGEDGLLSSVSFSLNNEKPQSVEEDALITGDRQIETGSFSDTESGQWKSEVGNHGFEAAIGLPIIYEGIPYGVFGVYTDRKNAFSTDEVDALEMIADLTAFSIGASERRRGDTSRQIVEVEFDVENTDLPFVRIASDCGCAIRLSETIQRNDGTTLTLYTIEDASSDRLDEIDTLIEGDTVRISEQKGSEYELTVVSSDPWWAELIGLYGANIAGATANEEGATLSVELPPSADVRSVVDLIEDRYPGAEPIARRERRRAERSVDEYQSLFQERLTNRQREVIETAYQAGYYEWPHEKSSEEVAKMLGITQPTFAEHFWTGQRQITELLIDYSEDHAE